MAAPRILVVGQGSIGRRHAENFASLGARVTPLGWRGTSLTDIAHHAAAADAMVIATATDVRLPLIDLAARAGLPVYVEKPLAFRTADLAAALSAAAPIASRSMLGLMVRYHPAVRALADADLSDVFHGSFSIGHDVRQWRADWRFSDSYAARPDGGGVLLDLCHEIDIAALLFSGLTLTDAVSVGHSDYPGVDMASRLILSRDALSVGVEMDYLTPALHRRIALHGTHRMHDFDLAAQRYTVMDAGGPRTLDLPLERNAMFLDAARDFLALVAGTPVANPHLPRLDRCAGSAALICAAWAARRFTGTVDVALT